MLLSVSRIHDGIIQRGNVPTTLDVCHQIASSPWPFLMSVGILVSCDLIFGSTSKVQRTSAAILCAAKDVFVLCCNDLVIGRCASFFPNDLGDKIVFAEDLFADFPEIVDFVVINADKYYSIIAQQ